MPKLARGLLLAGGLAAGAAMMAIAGSPQAAARELRLAQRSTSTTAGDSMTTAGGTSTVGHMEGVTKTQKKQMQQAPKIPQAQRHNCHGRARC
ncbi:MAG TPA: hypothetical protein VH249_16730 [Xanthobacteraceae bacterium]|jgi:hypothetical protein|nr:hypothetical protein [Xanthobacteraceae bacterium]